MNKRIAIFASGTGSNAENIITYFKHNFGAEVVLVLSNSKTATVLDKANHYNVESCVFTKEELYESEIVLQKLKDWGIDFIVLAGFLWRFPENILHEFPEKVINIHPALLPKYGGKGMYGIHIHRAVVTDKEKETGITIHYVNENYDDGKIIFQAKTTVSPDDSPEDIAKKIHQLEQEHFPRVIEKLVVEE